MTVTNVQTAHANANATAATKVAKAAVTTTAKKATVLWKKVA